MQTLGRQGLSDSQVRALLTQPLPTVGFGADLLGTGDISDHVVEASVERSMHADVHGTCEVTLLRDLDWGRDEVLLWETVDGVRFDRGVYVLTSPDQDVGEHPQPRTVSGYDRLWLLQREVGDTYVVAAGASYLDAIRTAIVDAGLTVSVYLTGDRQGTMLDEPAVWLMSDTPPTWLRVVNDLLAMIGYRGMWVDEVGTFRSGPYQNPMDRPVEWTFDLSDMQTNIVGEERTLSADVWGEHNRWRFVRRMDTEPAVGAGIYEVDRAEPGDLLRTKTLFFDAADQASLVSQGDAEVADDTADVRIVTMTTGPLPVAGHFDVVRFHDVEAGVDVKCQARRHSGVLGSGDMSWELEVL